MTSKLQKALNKFEELRNQPLPRLKGDLTKYREKVSNLTSTIRKNLMKKMEVPEEKESTKQRKALFESQLIDLRKAINERMKETKTPKKPTLTKPSVKEEKIEMKSDDGPIPFEKPTEEPETENYTDEELPDKPPPLQASLSAYSSQGKKTPTVGLTTPKPEISYFERPSSTITEERKDVNVDKDYSQNYPQGYDNMLVNSNESQVALNNEQKIETPDNFLKNVVDEGNKLQDSIRNELDFIVNDTENLSGGRNDNLFYTQDVGEGVADERMIQSNEQAYDGTNAPINRLNTLGKTTEVDLQEIDDIDTDAGMIGTGMFQINNLEAKPDENKRDDNIDSIGDQIRQLAEVDNESRIGGGFFGEENRGTRDGNINRRFDGMSRIPNNNNMRNVLRENRYNVNTRRNILRNRQDLASLSGISQSFTPPTLETLRGKHYAWRRPDRKYRGNDINLIRNSNAQDVRMNNQYAP